MRQKNFGSYKKCGEIVINQFTATIQQTPRRCNSGDWNNENDMKNNRKFIDSVFGSWQLCHKDTYELLSVLKDEHLSFVPKDKSEFQSLGYQFGCIISTQQAYTKMLKDRKYSNNYYFSKNKKKSIASTTKNILKLLKTTDTALNQEINKLTDDDIFNWGGVKTPAWRVISWLIEHERLHHGQLIIYFRLADIPLPNKFKKIWNL